MSDDRIDILVVDDMPEHLLTMRAVLEELGQNIICVSSGKEALRQLLERDFAVILLDVNMPDMDGFETAALIRQRNRSKHTPIIFVTAYSDETHAWQGYSLGAVDYIQAPVVPEVLRAKVGVFIDLFKKTEQIKRHADQRVVLAREQAARAAAEEATRRSNFLAEASAVLAGTLDYDGTLDALARLLIPRLSDGLLLCMRHEGNSWQTTAVEFDAASGQSARRSVLSSELPPKLVSEIDRALEVAALFGADRGAPAHRPSLESANPPATPVVSRCSHVDGTTLVPLYARGRLLGMLALSRRAVRPALSPSELSLVEDLADRAAIAIDNACLYCEIQANNERKDELLAMLGHELRNPLGAISNAVQCLRLAQHDAQARGAACEVLERQVQKMVRMVDDLLDVSRITRGTVALRKELVDVAAVVANAVAATKAPMASRGHELHVALPDESLQLVADSTRLEQILVNLLSNSAKYTNPGGQVWLAVEREADSIAFTVRDSGIGIPADVIPRIFDLFAQGGRTLDRSEGGLGIGLTLVRKLTELHGGSVTAQSDGPQRGSTFVLRLPLERSAQAEQPAGPPQQPATTTTASRRKIVLVEDNADLAATTAALLRKAGHEVHVAHDGLAALEAVSQCQPDAVLVDIGLPGMNGYELADRLQCGALCERPLLVAITGYGQESDVRRARAAGFDHHLVKPVEFQALKRILEGAATATRE